MWMYLRLKTRNKPQGRYLEVKRQERTYESQISGLKCNQQCTPNVFRDCNKSSKVRLISFKKLKHRQRRG